MASSDPLPTQGDVHATGFAGSWPQPDSRMSTKSDEAASAWCIAVAQRSLDRTVEVKVLTADLEPDNLERFLREQLAMGKLSGHPHSSPSSRSGRPPRVGRTS